MDIETRYYLTRFKFSVQQFIISNSTFTRGERAHSKFSTAYLFSSKMVVQLKNSATFREVLLRVSSIGPLISATYRISNI